MFRRFYNVIKRDGFVVFAEKAAGGVGELARTLGPAVTALAGHLAPGAGGGSRAQAGSQLLVPRYLLRPELGMTTAHEQAYFEWYARTRYSGCGHIVDLGAWLGSTTVPLARGLSKNATAHGRKIHAYDRWIWEPWMRSTIAGTPFENRFASGESFLPCFLETTAAWADSVEAHQGDLTQEQWSGGPIEFLLIDAMKSWDLANAIVRSFYPALMHGAYVLHQDFGHWFTPWIPLISWRLRGYLTPVYDVPRSSSLVFTLDRPIPSELLETTWTHDSFTDSDVAAAFTWARAVAPTKKSRIVAAQAKFHLDAGDRDRARTILSAFDGDRSGEFHLAEELAWKA